MKNNQQLLAPVLFVSFGIILNSCAGIEHAYVSSPRAEGAVEKIRSKCLSSGPSQKTFIQFEFREIDLCIGSEYNYQQSHIVSLGPYLIVPVPLIPMPVGIFELISPPKKKTFAEEITVVLKSKDDEVSFNPLKVTLIKGDKTEINPRRFECNWDELESPGKRHKFIWNVGIIPIKKSNDGPTLCELAFDSHDWDFDLLINGIEVKGQPILVPRIHFERGSYWSSEVAP